MICFLCFKRKFLLEQNNLKCPFCFCKINYDEKFIENFRKFDLPLQGKESSKSYENINLPDEKKTVINELCTFECNICKKYQLYCIHQCKYQSPIYYCCNCQKVTNQINDN